MGENMTNFINYDYYVNSLKEIALFYRYISSVDFSKLTYDDIQNVKLYVNKWYYYFHSKAPGRQKLMGFVAEKLRISNGYYGPKTIEEKALFYILMVDPNFLFLEVYEIANTIDERKYLAKLNFNLIDEKLMMLEKKCNNEFKFYNEDDFLSFERIKK